MSPRCAANATSDEPMEERTAAPEAPMPVSAVTAIEVEPVGAGVVTVGVGVGVAVTVGVGRRGHTGLAVGEA
jgi:hypothetical protein